MARDLFEQVLFAADIEAMTWRLDRPAIVGLTGFEAEPLENAFNNSIVDGSA